MSEQDEGRLEPIVSATTVVGEAEELAARLPRPIVEVDSGSLRAALPPGWRLDFHDVEHRSLEPLRPRGTAYVHDAGAFLEALDRRRLHFDGASDPVVYADEATNSLTAILNDDAGDAAGWRDYRIELLLRTTPEWAHWRGVDGQLLAQVAFAEHIENGLAELQEPEPATMLEIAQTFHATTSAVFKSGTRLASGMNQFRYEEEDSPSAGTSGTIEIPTRLTLVVAPFYGSARYEVGAFFRYRLSRAGLVLGYKLDRPHEVERAAFGDIRREVENAEDVRATFIAGVAPPPTEALGAK